VTLNMAKPANPPKRGIRITTGNIMPILNRAAEMQDEIAGWRRQHPPAARNPLRCLQDCRFRRRRLKEFGCDEIVTGIGRTGVVGVIKGRRARGRPIGLRADMDALPINEITGKPYASKDPGKMHACGHDGHTAMLLGAAKYLAETRNFSGSVAVIFQPAEEGGGGGNEMVKDGMMERFGIAKVFGMHNMPGLPSAISPSARARSWRLDRRVHHHDQGPRRPRGAAAQDDRSRS
jgi:metal-dependent amidase/aminoacylase/carboxypeptidase family protein